MDYKQLIETVLMMENQTSANISVPIFDDDVPETNEVLFVELRSVELVSTDFKGKSLLKILKNSVLTLKPFYLSYMQETFINYQSAFNFIIIFELSLL